MTASPSHSILILEDQKHTVDQVRHAIMQTTDLQVVGVATTLQEGLSKLATLRPDFVLTDLGLPDGSGIDVIRAAQVANWNCDTMVFSVFGDERRVIAAIRAGAKGYILKTHSPDSIVQDIRDVISGGSPMTPKIARYLLGLLNDTIEPPERPTFNLTQREHEILGYIARGYKRSEVGAHLNISVGTVGNHIHSIYRKLEVSSNIEAVAMATRTGLI